MFKTFTNTNTDNFNEFRIYNNINSDVVFSRKDNVYRVNEKYNRLLVGFIISEFTNLKNLQVYALENNMCLNFFIKADTYIDKILDGHISFCSRNNIKYHFKVFSSNGLEYNISMKLILKDYKKVNRSYIRSIKSINKFNL